MKEITLEATIENISKVTDFMDAFLEEHHCPLKSKLQIDIAIDELFGNIAHYAYGDQSGEATVCVEWNESNSYVTILFIDQGMPFNPLEIETPDLTLSAEERKLGGLGIHLVKKNMDEMEYQYLEGQNRLKIKKKI